MGRWPTRDDLGAAASSVSGLLLVSPDGTAAVPLGPDDRTRTARALRAAGVGERDRVVVALAEPAGSLWAAAAAEVAEAGAAVGPRGRMRLHHALTALRATTLVATPTGAMDFLARLHLEFLLDPLDLGLRTIVLTGEIASKRTMGHLAHEFGARVTEVLASPFGGAALAWRAAEQDPLTPLADDLLALASPAEDVLIESGPAELVLTTPGAVLRTGLVALGPDHAPPRTPSGSTYWSGGLWLALPRLEKALARIDGVTGWELAVSRQGDAGHGRADGDVRAREPDRQPHVEGAHRGVRTRAHPPISVAVEIAPKVSETPAPGTVNDLRGHHLGRDRSLIT
ncbi:hypothetical protein [Nonomuraea salmonea]|uniref:hypothetical protein n=1 Tax=Nonomuraea salmonea TaxID=46181 RepID=UPI002FECC0AD